ncbi:MAG: VWA domain-containing protein [Candidatus Nomurabacteria bacterium]|nr:VWA domain-containing protein [Candidatus Nomurabacteria bacterium]
MMCGIPSVSADTKLPVDFALVIDATNSMEGAALEYEKEAAKSFCDQLLPNQRVAVFAVGPATGALCDFTNDQQTLLSCIDGIEAGGGTDLTEMFKMVGLKLADSGYDDAAKVVIFMSDGVSTMGQSVDDDKAHYKSEDYPDAGYCGYTSAAYLAAKKVKGEIVPVRFTPTGTNTDYNSTYVRLGIDFMNDIASSGCFVVPSMDSMLEIIGGVHQAVSGASSKEEISSNLKNASQKKRLSTGGDIGDVNLSYYMSMAPEMGMQNWLVKWGPNLFTDSKTYNHGLARACGALVKNFGDESLLSDSLVKLGFTDIKIYSPRVAKIVTTDTTNFVFARQNMKINGAKRSLVVCIITGTDGVAEWISNLKMQFDPSGDYHGFAEPALVAYSYLTEYVKDHSIDSRDNYYLVTGHSRGAAVANLVAKSMQDEGFTSAEKAFVYTFACPNTTLQPAGGYDNIFNIVDGNDVVTQVPPGARKYGQTVGYDASGDSIAHLKQLYGDQFELDNVAEQFFWAHYPENYLARLHSGAPKAIWTGKKWYRLSVECPVDIRITRQSSVVAEVSKNLVVELDDDVFADTYGDGKYFLLPGDSEVYDVEIVATGSGVMNILAQSFTSSVDDEPEILVEEKVDIKPGDTFKLHLSDTDKPELVLLDTVENNPPVSAAAVSNEPTTTDDESELDIDNATKKDSRQPTISAFAIGLALRAIVVLTIFAARKRRPKNSRR